MRKKLFLVIILFMLLPNNVNADTISKNLLAPAILNT